MILIGIDPGLSGGIVALNEDREIIDLITMPTKTYIKANKEKNTIDIAETCACLNRLRQSDRFVFCYMEKVNAMPKQGVVSMFNFGYSFGVLEALLVACAIPYTLVTPQSWTKIIHKDLSKDIPTKERSKIVVKSLFPKVNLRATKRSTTIHSGLMDALLIAEYGLRDLKK